ncbi:MAG: hypothetical protein AAF725_27675, partial [Acidobacteriota bacterium]
MKIPSGLGGDGQLSAGESWRLCGVLESARLRREAMALAPSRTMALLCLGLFLLGLLSHAKPLLMAPQERLMRGDLVFLTAGTLLMLLVLTQGLAAFSRLSASVGQLDEQLHHLAHEVRAELIEDLSRLERQLDTLDRRRSRGLAEFAAGWTDDERTVGEAQGADVPRETYLYRSAAAAAGGAGDPSRLGTFLDPRAPLISSVFWLDEDGFQIHKATARDKNTAPVALAHRAYFRQIKARNGLLRGALCRGAGCRRRIDAGAAPGGEKRIFIETKRSITTGQEIFALSRASASSGASVAVVTGVLPSMEALVTPPFHFALTESDGTVILSSHEGLAIGGDVAALLSDPPSRLRRALESGSGGVFEAEIENRPHRFLARTLVPDSAWRAGPGWRVLTFYEYELPSTLVAETLLLSVLLCLVYAALFTALCWLARSPLREMFWQREALLEVYRC